MRLRWLVPSLSDLVFIALFVWLFVAGGFGWYGLLVDGDIGWHIRTGDYILDHYAVPRTDLFSFTKPGAPWFAWEWLSDVVFAIAHRWAGLKGVVLLAGAAIALWPMLLLRQALGRGANVWAALGVVLAGTGAASVHFLARPHIFTLLFTTIAVWLIESDRRSPNRRVWLLVPLAALWANMHGGFVVLIVLLGIAAIGSLRYGAIAVACALATLFNPYGIQLHAHILEYLRSDWIRNVVQEFQAPTFRSENQLQFELLLITGLMLAAALLARRRFVEAAWIVVFAHLALTSVRHVPVYVAVTAPLLAETLSDLWRGYCSSRARDAWAHVLYIIGEDLAPGFRRTSVWLACFIAGFAFLGKSAHWPTDFPTSYFPVSLIRANEAVLANGRVLTLDQWADYLIYAYYPRQKVFADGRSDFIGRELGSEYLGATQGERRWRETLDRFRVDTVLAPVGWPLANLLKADANWRVIADDGRAVLFTHSAWPEESRSAASNRGWP